MKKWNKAFTLVELIVVITILAILWTIAFLSLQGYSQNARDWVRVSDIKNIEKWLAVMLVKSGIVPTPDDTKINIMASWTIVGIQGYAGKLMQAQIGMSKDSGKDPLDWTFYTYSTNASKTEYQILGFLESSISQNSLLWKSYAVDYSQRKIVTKWSELGILLWNSGTTINQPAQEFNVGNIETATGTTVFKAVFTESKNITASWGTLLTSAILNKWATECTAWMTELKLSNGQIWSCMNLWATTVRDWITQPTNCLNISTTNCNAWNTWIWDYYQWGRNDTWFTASPGDWQWPQNDNAWWNTTNTSLARQWPCPTGWHVPSSNEWQQACNTILWTTCVNGMAYNPLISSKLKLPFAGYRNWVSSNYNAQSVYFGYWSSTTNTTNAYYLSFSNSIINPADYNYRGFGFSLRCIKN